MGRLFVTNLKEPVYRCKKCLVEIVVYNSRVKIKQTLNYSGKVAKFYSFSKCYNVEIGTHKVIINQDIKHTMFEVYCVPCGSLVGLCYERLPGDTGMYNERLFSINRIKLHGPPGESDDEVNP